MTRGEGRVAEPPARSWQVWSLAGPQLTPLITSAPIAVGSPRTRRALDQRKLSYPCRNFAHMFQGSGFGVGLTVNQLDVPGWPGGELVPADPAWHPTRLGELMPVAARSGAALAEETRRANIAESRLGA